MRGYKYCTVVLYAGEIPGYNRQPDCWQFDSVKEAAEWLYTYGHAKSIRTAISGLSNVLRGKSHHYKGFTLSVAYTADN